MPPGKTMRGKDWSGQDLQQAGRFSFRLLLISQLLLLMEMWKFDSSTSPCSKIPGKLGVQEESFGLGTYRDNCCRRKETFSWTRRNVSKFSFESMFGFSWSIWLELMLEVWHLRKCQGAWIFPGTGSARHGFRWSINHLSMVPGCYGSWRSNHSGLGCVALCSPPSPRNSGYTLWVTTDGQMDLSHWFISGPLRSKNIYVEPKINYFHSSKRVGKLRKNNIQGNYSFSLKQSSLLSFAVVVFYFIKWKEP